MRTIEITGKTVEDAILTGLQELGLSRDRVEIEILDAGSKGFLGLGSRLARVRLTENKEERISFADIITADLDMSLEFKGEKSKKTQRKATQPKKQMEKKEKEAPEKQTEKKEKEKLDKKEERVQPFSLEGERISPKLKRAEGLHLKREESEHQPVRKAPPRERSERRHSTRERRQTTFSNVSDEIWPVPQDEAGLKAYNFAQDIITAMKLDCQVNVKSDEEGLYVDLIGDADDLGVLIGKRGVTLDAFQYLLNVVVNKEKEDKNRVTLNVGDYRQRREKTLIRLAERMAQEVMEKGRPRSLEPMTPRERRLIHMALQEFDGVYTESRGEDNLRHIVIYKQ